MDVKPTLVSLVLAAAFVGGASLPGCSSSKPTIVVPSSNLLGNCDSGGSSSQTSKKKKTGSDGDYDLNDEGYGLVQDVVSYDSGIKEIFDKHCISCHKPGVVEPPLQTWEDVDKYKTKIPFQISTNAMPPNGPYLAEDEAELISLWKRLKYPETDSDAVSDSGEANTSDADNSSTDTGDDSSSSTSKKKKTTASDCSSSGSSKTGSAKKKSSGASDED